MVFCGVATPTQLKMLAEIFDERCIELHIVDDAYAREELAHQIMSMLGACSIEEIAVRLRAVPRETSKPRSEVRLDRDHTLWVVHSIEHALTKWQSFATEASARDFVEGERVRLGLPGFDLPNPKRPVS